MILMLLVPSVEFEPSIGAIVPLFRLLGSSVGDPLAGVKWFALRVHVRRDAQKLPALLAGCLAELGLLRLGLHGQPHEVEAADLVMADRLRGRLVLQHVNILEEGYIPQACAHLEA